MDTSGYQQQQVLGDGSLDPGAGAMEFVTDMFMEPGSYTSDDLDNALSALVRDICAETPQQGHSQTDTSQLDGDLHPLDTAAPGPCGYGNSGHGHGDNQIILADTKLSCFTISDNHHLCVNRDVVDHECTMGTGTGGCWQAVRPAAACPTNNNLVEQRSSVSLSADGMEDVRRQLLGDGFHENVVNVIMASWGPSVSHKFTPHLTRWRAFCEARNINYVAPPPNAILCFLYDLHLEGLGNYTVNVAKSAVFSLLSSLPETHSALVNRFMKGLTQLGKQQVKTELRGAACGNLERATAYNIRELMLGHNLQVELLQQNRGISSLNKFKIQFRQRRVLYQVVVPRTFAVSAPGDGVLPAGRRRRKSSADNTDTDTKPGAVVGELPRWVIAIIPVPFDSITDLKIKVDGRRRRLRYTVKNRSEVKVVRINGCDIDGAAAQCSKLRSKLCALNVDNLATTKWLPQNQQHTISFADREKRGHYPTVYVYNHLNTHVMH